MNASASLFLRRALMLDAAASGATGLLMIAGAGVLESLLALPAPLLRGAGLVLVPYVAFVVLVATRANIAASAVGVVIACNAAVDGGELRDPRRRHRRAEHARHAVRRRPGARGRCARCAAICGAAPVAGRHGLVLGSTRLYRAAARGPVRI